MGLTEGRMVHYVLPRHAKPNVVGEHRPATVVKVWDKEAGTCNLMVFVDGTNDWPEYTGPVWATSVRYSDLHEEGTWHWMEQVK